MANQPFFKYIKRTIAPAEIQKIMQKNGWFAPPAPLADGAASLIFFENGSRIVQYLLPRKRDQSEGLIFFDNLAISYLGIIPKENLNNGRVIHKHYGLHGTSSI